MRHQSTTKLVNLGTAIAIIGFLHYPTQQMLLHMLLRQSFYIPISWSQPSSAEGEGHKRQPRSE